jgi:threonine dehydratase
MQEKDNTPNLKMVREARENLKGVARQTPVLASQLDPGLAFKAENLQVTGSFKIRPAYNQLFYLPKSDRVRGVVTSSSGNFAQGAALAGRLLGVDMKIVMMRSSNPLKVRSTQKLGAEVVYCEDNFSARGEKVTEIVEKLGCSTIHPYNHIHAVAGNGTVAMEILEQAPDVKNIVVPISGGGLMSGIALIAKILKPSLKIWGVQSVGSNATYLSFQNRKRCSIDRAETIADGLAVTIPGDLTFPIILENVDSVVAVQEETILAAVKHFLWEERIVVEPSGAVTLAAILEGQVPIDDTVLVLSGGNIAPAILRQVVD